MYYVGDHHHYREGGPEFREAVRESVARLDGGTVFVEHETYHEGKKARLESLYEGVASGETTVTETDEGLHLARDGAEQTIDGSHQSLVRAMREHPDAVSNVDVGPVHSKRCRATRTAMTGLLRRVDGGVGDERDREWLHRVTAEYVRLRDEEFVHRFDGEVEAGRVDPENALVIMGAGHNLDRRLAEDHPVERANADVPPTNEFSAAAKLVDREDAGLDEQVPRAAFAEPYAVARSDDQLPVAELRAVRAANEAGVSNEARLVDDLLARVEDLSDEDVARTADRDADLLGADHDWVPGGDEVPEI